MMPITPIRISIAMATFNGAKYIREQLDSILKQSYTNFELVIVDDCSTDSTLNILKTYQESDFRILIHQNLVNLGFKNNFEKTISLCSSEYIALSDQDDVWDVNHLQYLVDNIGDKSLVCSNANLIDENGRCLDISMKDILSIEYVPSDDLKIFKHLLFQNFVQGATALFNKNILRDALPIPETIVFHDHWLALIAASNNGIRYLEKSSIRYRQHESNITHNVRWSFLNIFRSRVSNNYHLCSELYIRVQQKLDVKYSREIKKAIEYHKDAKKKKLHILAAYFFANNYYDIYWRKKNILYIPRVIKVFLGIY